MIFLFTDFGAADIYVGQVKAVFAAFASQLPAGNVTVSEPAAARRMPEYLHGETPFRRR